ncbi:MAG: winged helix-turn-helix domain-containing protein, partial [Rhodobiaceae bacterium]|nr:winged helix-turn-helix domain-containing protein [Rhodobiaceae bacterium]
DATGRLARTIAWLFNPVLFPDVGDRLEISQQELALLSGLSRQAANKALKTLADEGLLATDAGGIEVRNVDRLIHYGE